MTTLRHAIVAVLLATSATAQKLPNVQQGGLRAPANIKIDGKLTEWGAQLKAYNNATDVNYTIANDNENLYLSLKTNKYFVIENIIRHGIRFTINHSISKKDESPVVITYPAMEFKERGPIIDLMASKFFEQVRKPVDNSDKALNTLLQSKSKFIRVEGINDIADKLIPLYNDKEIIALSAFEKSSDYVYELAIPLKYLPLNNENAAFSYQIKINYPHPDEKKPVQQPPPPGVTVIELQPLKASVAVTDFWGEYTLAK